MIPILVSLAILASFLLLLRSEVGPILIHRPIVLGPLLGAPYGLAPAGFFLGALLEWVWIDRIPAGGLRTPAVSVGTAAALMGLVTVRGGDLSNLWPVPTDQMLLGLILALIYTYLFVPLDGGLRRLWNLASENVILGLEQGSWRELRALTPVAIAVRMAFVAAGLLTAAPLAQWLDRGLALGPTGAVPWMWALPAAALALLLRNGGRADVALGTAGFLAAAGAAWLI